MLWTHLIKLHPFFLPRLRFFCPDSCLTGCRFSLFFIHQYNSRVCGANWGLGLIFSLNSALGDDETHVPLFYGFLSFFIFWFFFSFFPLHSLFLCILFPSFLSLPSFFFLCFSFWSPPSFLSSPPLSWTLVPLLVPSCSFSSQVSFLAVSSSSSHFSVAFLYGTKAKGSNLNGADRAHICCVCVLFTFTQWYKSLMHLTWCSDSTFLSPLCVCVCVRASWG